MGETPHKVPLEKPFWRATLGRGPEHSEAVHYQQRAPFLGMPSLPFAVGSAEKSGLRGLYWVDGGGLQWHRKEGTGGVLSGFFWLDDFSFSRPHSINPKRALLHVVIDHFLSKRFDGESRKLMPSYAVHTDDIVGTGGTSCRFLFPLPGEAEEECHPKVPRATSQLFFFLGLGWKVLTLDCSY